MMIDLTEEINETEDMYIISAKEVLLLFNEKYEEIFFFFRFIKVLLNEI